MIRKGQFSGSVVATLQRRQRLSRTSSLLHDAELSSTVSAPNQRLQQTQLP